MDQLYKDRINQVADFIEKLQHQEIRKKEGGFVVPFTGAYFNMNWWKLIIDSYGRWARTFESICGTTMCIGGWIEKSFSNGEKANVWLDLTVEEEDRLFYPDNVELGEGKTLNDITPQQAAETLRHFAKTGEVVWNV